ncbi:MAG: 4-hydroxy-tetrahydrodipicolinate reductase [Desulfohalobiaceae bacterium]
MSQTKIVVMGAAGRMGSTLVELVQADPELELVGALETEAKLSSLQGLECRTGSDLNTCLQGLQSAVVVDFTHPESTSHNVRIAAQADTPMVIGTTGFSQEQEKILQQAADQVPIFWAPNMSVGINVLLELMPKLVTLLGSEFDLEISEIHHKHKKDAPSGTAVKLGQILAQSRQEQPELRYCRQGMIGERPKQEIGIQTLRGGDVVGEHTVYFLGPGERIDLTHRVYSRQTFAQGALRVAKWIGSQSPGRVYSMSDFFADLISD